MVFEFAANFNIKTLKNIKSSIPFYFAAKQATIVGMEQEITTVAPNEAPSFDQSSYVSPTREKNTTDNTASDRRSSMKERQAKLQEKEAKQKEIESLKKLEDDIKKSKRLSISKKSPRHSLEQGLKYFNIFHTLLNFSFDRSGEKGKKTPSKSFKSLKSEV